MEIESKENVTLSEPQRVEWVTDSEVKRLGIRRGGKESKESIVGTQVYRFFISGWEQNSFYYLGAGLSFLFGSGFSTRGDRRKKSCSSEFLEKKKSIPAREG